MFGVYIVYKLAWVISAKLKCSFVYCSAICKSVCVGSVSIHFVCIGIVCIFDYIACMFWSHAMFGYVLNALVGLPEDPLP